MLFVTARAKIPSITRISVSKSTIPPASRRHAEDAVKD